jgi:hypothetical protein
MVGRLGGHIGAVYSVCVIANRLFSGSYDSTIKVSCRQFTCAY